MADLSNTHNHRVQKHPRINMAFYGDNLDYVRSAAWKAKMSVTEYVNTLIEADKAAKASSSPSATQEG